MGVKIGYMSEYYTEGVILNHVPRNEKDTALTIYTKELGKITAISKSIRKITSKLAGHLRVGSIANLRVIDAGSFQVVDALAISNPIRSAEIFAFLKFIDDMTPQNQSDLRLWYTVREIVESGKISEKVYRYIIELMGFASSSEILCKRCRRGGDRVAYFYSADIIFLCTDCILSLPININEAIKIS